MIAVQLSRTRGAARAILRHLRMKIATRWEIRAQMCHLRVGKTCHPCVCGWGGDEKNVTHQATTPAPWGFRGTFGVLGGAATQPLIQLPPRAANERRITIVCNTDDLATLLLLIWGFDALPPVCLYSNIMRALLWLWCWKYIKIICILSLFFTIHFHICKNV